jgi:hypothetical protein
MTYDKYIKAVVALNNSIYFYERTSDNLSTLKLISCQGVIYILR